MKSPIAKLAAAAVIVVVVLGIFELVGTNSNSGMAWGKVAKKVEASRGFICRITQTQTIANMDEPIKTCTIMYRSAEYGAKAENCPGAESTVTTYVDRADRTIVSLFHRIKKYTRRSLPDEEKTGQIDPKEIVKQYVSGDYRELGRRTIEGVEAEGIEVENPPGFTSNFSIDSHVARLWVSVETGYPIMLENDIVGNNGDLCIEMVADEFQWNVELDPIEFRVEIPADYTLMDMDQPQTTKKTNTITRKYRISHKYQNSRKYRSTRKYQSTREYQSSRKSQSTRESHISRKSQISRKYQSSGDDTVEMPEP